MSSCKESCKTFHLEDSKIKVRLQSNDLIFVLEYGTLLFSFELFLVKIDNVTFVVEERRREEKSVNSVSRFSLLFVASHVVQLRLQRERKVILDLDSQNVIN